MKRVAKRRIIFSNYDVTEAYDAAKETLEESGITPTDNQVWEQVWRDEELEWHQVMSELKSILGNGHYLAVGTCGVWYGTFAGGFMFESAEEALCRILHDCDYCSIWDENGHLYVRGSHHDGSNFVEIKQITDAGLQYYQNWEDAYSSKLTEREVHARIMNCSKYSRLIHFANRVYGLPRFAWE